MVELNPDDITGLLQRGDRAALQALLSGSYPADVVELLSEVEDEDERLALFRLLEPEEASKVVAEAGVFEVSDMLPSLQAPTMAGLIARLPADDIVEILEDLPEGDAEGVLGLMPDDVAGEARHKLRYPMDSAGRLMSPHFVRVQLRWTVDETVKFLRTVDPENETFAHLYAVNARDQLVGLVRMRHLLTAQPEVLLADLVEPKTVSVATHDDQEEVARSMAKYNVTALPVIDAGGKLVGVVTHDDVLDVLEEEATEDIHKLGGSAPLEEPYLLASTRTLVGKRVGWLLLLLLTSTLTLVVMSSFKGQLAEVAALAWFIPLLIGTGGNAGSQTTSMVIRALAVGDVELGDEGRVWWRELRAGVLLGGVLAVLGGSVALVCTLTMSVEPRVALVVALSAFALVLWSTSVGSLLPLVAARFRLDPTVVSGPLMSTLVDATGLFIYFSIARWVLGI